jgi:anti-sigma factor RsiW
MLDEQDDTELSAVVKARASRYQAPPELAPLIRAALAAPPTEPAAAPPASRWWLQWPWLKLGAAAACGVLASVLVLQLYGTPAAQAQVGEEVVAAHVRSLMVAHLEDIASTDQHTVKPWFAGKLDFSPPVNDFSRQGFPLIGGRLDYIDRHFAAALVYRRNGHVINVFVWPSRDADMSQSHHARQEGFNLIAWRNAGMQFWVVSDVSADDLQQFSKLLREQGG